MKKSVLLVLPFLFALSTFAQEKFQLKDPVSNEAVPFVKVIPDLGPQRLADLDGYFTLHTPGITSFQLKALGYRDTTILLSELNGSVTIFMTRDAQELSEVKVLPGENPAHRIMDRVIANRKRNSPTENTAFRYNSYSKLYFTMDPDAIQRIPPETQDSSLISLRSFFNSQYLFLMESSSERQFEPPARDKEIIKAYKVSGFTDPMFSTFANEMQSFSFYENQFELLGKSYINPIALGGTRRYLFILEDTTVVGQDTTFTISFRPRKGKNFEGLQGQLFINTNGYAIEKVISEPYETEGDAFSVKIVQEYQLIDNRQWFPVKLSSELALLSMGSWNGLDNPKLIGKGTTYVEDIVLDPELKRSDFRGAELETAENAANRSEQEWDSSRVYRLTETERKTYRVIDSVSGVYKLDYRLMLLKSLADGKIPMGYVNLDVRRLLNFNLYEGCRLGLGLETSAKTMQRATVGGYFGWGTKDHDWKYGGFAEYRIYPKKELKLKLTYQQDLLQRGGNEFRSAGMSLNPRDIYRDFYIRNFERQRLGELMLSGYVTPRLKLALLGNYQRIWFTEGYQFLPAGPLTQTDLAETSLELSWQFREKVMQLGDKRVSTGSKFPRINVKVTKGWKDVFESGYDYTRLHAEIIHDVSLRGVGKFSWMLSGSRTFGEVPLFLLQTGVATGKNWRLSVANTFETMLPSAFFADRQASLFTRLTLLSWKTKYKWLEPQLSVHHGIGYGAMDHPSNHNLAIQSMDKGYFEGGIVVDKLLISGFSGIGLGVFTNYGYYANPRLEKNLVVKLSLSINF